MVVDNGAAGPATGNPTNQGTTEGHTGDAFDGLFSGASDKGSANPAEGHLTEGAQGGGTPAAPVTPAPLANGEQPASVAPWKKQLKADLQGDPRLNRFDGFDAMTRGYLELEGKLGTAIVPPGKDAKPEDWQVFYKRIGRPEKPEDYPLDDVVLPEGFEKDENGQAAFKKLAFSIGLSSAQAKQLFANSMKNVAELQAGRQRQMAEATAKCAETLKKEWGPQFQENQELAKRVIAAHGSQALLGRFREAGLTADADFMRFLGKVGREMREDSLIPGSGAGMISDPASPTGGAFKYPGI